MTTLKNRAKLSSTIMSRNARAGHAGQRHHRSELAGDRAGNDVERQHERGGEQHDEGRQQRAEEDGREDDRVHAQRFALDLLWTWAIRASMVVSVLPVNA